MALYTYFEIDRAIVYIYITHSNLIYKYIIQFDDDLHQFTNVPKIHPINHHATTTEDKRKNILFT
jgi:hypothetical protein